MQLDKMGSLGGHTAALADAVICFDEISVTVYTVLHPIFFKNGLQYSVCHFPLLVG